MPLEKPGMEIGAGHADAQPVVIGRTRARIPEFLHVLRRNAKLVVLPVQEFQCGSGRRAQPTLTLDCAKQNIRIDENLHQRSGYQSSRFIA